MFSYMMAHLRDLGHSVEFAVSALGLVAAGQIVGKLGVGALGHRIEPRFLWSAGMFLIAIGFFLSMHAESRSTVYLFALSMGVGNGVSIVALPTMLGNYFGPTHFAKLFGFTAPITTVVGSAAPLLVALSYGWMHTYAIAFLAIACLLVVSAVVIA
jgi:MFS family permease